MFGWLYTKLKNKLREITNLSDLIVFAKKGNNVIIDRNLNCKGGKNVYIGNDCRLGENNVIFASDRPLFLGNHVTTGPGVMFFTGNHRTNYIGEYMREVTVAMKQGGEDKPIVVEDDVMIGAGRLILSGVTIGCGCVIYPGSKVINNLKPYTVLYPDGKKRRRFTPREISEHERLMKEKYGKDFYQQRSSVN